jgi:hypothetical protein
MYWVLLDIGLAVVAVLVLGFTGFTLYRNVRGLLRAVSASSRELAGASAGRSDPHGSGPQRR